MAETRNRVRYSEELVREMESLSAEGWRRMRAHRLYGGFMLEYLRARCVLDLWTFVKVVYFDAMKHYDESLHGPGGLTRYLTDWTRLDETGTEVPVSVKFIIWAREHCKTQFVIAWDAWQFVRDVNARGLIRAYNDPKAHEICSAVRQLMESRRFQYYFPWVRPQLKKNNNQPVLWREDKFLLERDDIGVRVPSMEAGGMDAEPTGGHFNFGHYDDFEVRINANSEVLRAKMLDVWHNDDNLFLAGHRRVFCGTPWSREGMIHRVLRGLEPFDDHPYGLSIVPAEVKVFDQPFTGDEPVLLEDRKTLRDINAYFPTVGTNLQYCQAVVRFFHPEIKDVVEEIREVERNDVLHFTVSRPFPAHLGQPISYRIGAVKPACPTRFTLDAVDLHPAASRADSEIPRSSLVQKRRTQGTLVYHAQMLLEPGDPEALVFNPDLIQVIGPEQIPGGAKRWFRAVDFATSKKSAASTAMTTAFKHVSGLYLTHIKHENQLDTMGKILELLLGVLRVKQQGGELEMTLFEKGMIESTVGDFLPEAERDPAKFFKQATKSKYRQFTEAFTESGPIRIRRRNVPRPSNSTKRLRLVTMQPFWEAQQLFVVVGPGYVEQSVLEDLQYQAESFRLEREEPYDLLDNVHDLIMETPMLRPAKAQKAPLGIYHAVNRRAMLENAMTGLATVTGWPPRN
ncbi:MAG: hypothetical protein RBU21_05925 [FCB group bacterium]|jgi:hypothetical protein|nr:hypothetical protein [FCB group bacterium]